MPPFPATMSSQERVIAHASEMLLYALLFVQPLVGWGMLSAARYPIVLYGPLHLFPILPHSVMLYAALRQPDDAEELSEVECWMVATFPVAAFGVKVRRPADYELAGVISYVGQTIPNQPE